MKLALWLFLAINGATPIPTVVDAQHYAENRLGTVQYQCLNRIVIYESKWNTHATNSGGAYGIPQAWPAEKMSSKGEDWRDNPVTQIRWMIDYIDDKYGSACQAAMYELGWWDQNGEWHQGHGIY